MDPVDPIDLDPQFYFAKHGTDYVTVSVIMFPNISIPNKKKFYWKTYSYFTLKKKYSSSSIICFKNLITIFSFKYFHSNYSNLWNTISL